MQSNRHCNVSDRQLKGNMAVVSKGQNRVADDWHFDILTGHAWGCQWQVATPEVRPKTVFINNEWFVLV